MALEIDRLSVDLGAARVVADVSAVLRQGECLGISGPSGAGKSTLLRAVTGLTAPIAGTIRFDDAVWFSAKEKRHVEPWRRKVSLVFQDLALWPHVTAGDHVELVLKYRRDVSRRDRGRISDELLAFVELDGCAAALPARLSGGQQQRLAIARSLASNSSLLLMDEPFSHLDEALTARLWERLQRRFAASGTTVVIVSHDERWLSANIAHRLVLNMPDRTVDARRAAGTSRESSTSWVDA